MFCSPSAYKLHKEAFDTVGCVEKYIIYPEKEDEREITYNFTKKVENQDGVIKKIDNENGGLLFTEFVQENVNLNDFLAVSVDGFKDFLFIIFSSGTTGLPKGVPWTHVAFLLNSLCNCNESFKNASILNTREWYYTYGLLYTLACIRVGCTVVYSPRNEERDWLKAIEKYKIKILQLAPATITELTKSSLINQFDLTSVETVISSSTPINDDKVKAFKKRLPSVKNLYQTYGTSEAGCAGNEITAKYGPKSGSVGMPSPGFIFKVVDLASKKILGPNQRGEIRFKSPCLTPGYLNVDNSNHMDEDGFYKTGDVGYYDDQGYFYIVNRIKELIKYNDISIAPAELEAILELHPSVREAGVTGLPCEKSGERPVAAVVLVGGQVTKRDLIEFINQRITYRMRLTGVCFVEKLPRGAGEKLDRKALKDIVLSMNVGHE